MNTAFMTPQKAWHKLRNYKSNYYDSNAALYSGDHDELARTGESKTFWHRHGGNCRVHVPVAADIAAMSANLLFSEEPKCTVFHKDTERNESRQQKRFEEILRRNNFTSKLNEAAETAAAMGDVYIKIRWSDKIDYPLFDIVQPDNALPEYILGDLQCVHFFNPAIVDEEHDRYTRIYERYERGMIYMKVFEGSSDDLGVEGSTDLLEKLGYKSEIKVPINEIMAAHIPNIRPNRMFRASMMGRSDFDGLRDLCDSLDEVYSSWMRDVRLAKARLIVPLEYLKHKPESMANACESTGTFEFDTDIETYVAMDIDPDTSGGTGITPSQFAIRSTEHAMTCSNLLETILSLAGYSPQSFGLNVTNYASGTALNIRERKSAVTKNKKQTYWQAPLEKILTAMLWIDHALYPKSGSDGKDVVRVAFSDSMGVDTATMASVMNMLTSAEAVSTEIKIRMLHPDWSDEQISDEISRVKAEFGKQSMEEFAASTFEGDFEGLTAQAGETADDLSGKAVLVNGAVIDGGGGAE